MISKSSVILLLVKALVFLCSASGCSEKPTERSDTFEIDYVDETFDVNEWKEDSDATENIYIGGTKIAIPPPNGYVRATDTFFGEILFELLESPSFKNYSCFLREEDFANLEDEEFADRWEDDYTFFTVRSLKMAEKIDATPKTLLEAQKASHGSKVNVNQKVADLREKIKDEVVTQTKKNLKDFDLIQDEEDFQVGGMKVLPIHDSSRDHYSFVQYSKATLDGETIVEGNVASLILVNRKIFYLYATTNQTDSVDKLKLTMKYWVRSILHKNK
jgi:hypothetical protein